MKKRQTLSEYRKAQCNPFTITRKKLNKSIKEYLNKGGQITYLDPTPDDNSLVMKERYIVTVIMDGAYFYDV